MNLSERRANPLWKNRDNRWVSSGAIGLGRFRLAGRGPIGGKRCSKFAPLRHGRRTANSTIPREFQAPNSFITERRFALWPRIDASGTLAPALMLGPSRMEPM